MQTTKENNPHLQLRHVDMECQLLIVIVILLLMPLVECWCMDMPSGVDHTNRRMIQISNMGKVQFSLLE